MIDRETIRALTARCRHKAQCIASYELAPTGNIHAGIVRSLLYTDQLRAALAREGISLKLHFRVNDRSAVKRNRERIREQLIGRQYRDIGDLVWKKSLVDMFEEECHSILENFTKLEIKKCRISSLYESAAFQHLLWQNLGRMWEINCKTPYSSALLFPKVGTTGKMYDTIVTRDAYGEFTYTCNATKETKVVSRDVNGGLLAFKFETAIVWRHFDVDVDIHASNHRQAFGDSCEIYSTLFGGGSPIAPRLGIVIGYDGKMASKSRGNSRSVIEYMEHGEYDLLVKKLLQHKAWRDIPI